MSEFAKLLGPGDARRSPRLTFALPVKIRGRDASGQAFTENTSTVDVNERGGKLHTRFQLRPRDPIYVENPMLKVATIATVAWVGRRRHHSEPWEIGIALDKPQNLWGIDFPAGSPARHASRTPAAEAKTAIAMPPASPASLDPTLPHPASQDGGPPTLRPGRFPKASGAALRRSTRLTISVAITVIGKDAEGKEFTEQTRTISVNKHGGKIHSQHQLKLNDKLLIENLKIKKKGFATIAWISEKKNPGDPWEVGVALDDPQNLWGVDFPPDDWETARPIREPKPEAAAPPAEFTVSTPAEEPAASADATQVGVAPPLLAPEAPSPPAPTVASSRPMIASVPAANLQITADHLSEQMKLLAEAHTRLFQHEFADMAAGIREKMQKEITQMVESAVSDATTKTRSQMQHDLEQFAGQLTEMERHVTDACVNGLRKRLSAMLATLDQKP